MTLRFDYKFNISESKRYYRAAEKRLELYGGISRSRINAIRNGSYVKSDIAIYSDMSGILLKKYVYSGQHFTRGQTLFKIAGLNKLWMNAWIYQNDLKFVHKNSAVSVEFSAYPGRIFNGRVSFVYPYLKSRARITEARIVFNNSKGLLQPGMFGNVKFVIKPQRQLSVKASSVSNCIYPAARYAAVKFKSFFCCSVISFAFGNIKFVICFFGVFIIFIG